MQATGNFEVKLDPQSLSTPGQEAAIGRMSIDKQFRGDLEAVSKGEMLMVMTETRGSAGYVAIERITGTLHGRAGSFVLQHSGTMNRGAQTLICTVVPDSGTGELAGISGRMAIDVSAGHAYTFDYDITASV